MTIDSIIFFDLILAIFVLALALAIIVVYLSNTIKKLHSFAQKRQNVEAEIERKNSYLLEDTRQKAVRILDEANNKAMDIIQKATLFSRESHDNFNNQVKEIGARQIKSFEKAIADFIKLYSEVLNNLKSKNIEVFQDVSKNIEISTLEEIKKFKETIMEETISSEKMVRTKVNHEYSLAKQEIDNYKKEHMDKINDSIYELLEKVAKLVLGKTINISDHEKLIIDSLEKAKQEGLFN